MKTLDNTCFKEAVCTGYPVSCSTCSLKFSSIISDRNFVLEEANSEVVEFQNFDVDKFLSVNMSVNQ